MAIINPLLSMLVLLIALIYAVLIISFVFSISKINTNYMSKNAKTIVDFKELTDGINTIKYSNGNEIIKEKLEQDYIDLTKIGLRGNIVYSLQNSISVALESISTILALYLGSQLVLTGSLTIGYLVTFSMLISYMLLPIKDLVESQPSIQKAIVAFHRLNDVIYANDEIKIFSDNEHIMDGNIEFCNISFSYVPNIPVIDNFNLTICRGEKVGIEGNNGTGKSSLVKLLLAINKPQKGTIKLNGCNIEKLSPQKIRNNIIYIPQDIFIFSDTIKRNITMGDNNISDTDILKVLKIVMLEDFISELPEGLDTYLYENGKNLSGGQRQKIVIARALVRKPKILIMDEATSQIDNNSDAQIYQSIFENYKDTTYIIISHKKNILKYCDKIISLNK
jgi:ATP-binding cassette subfamily B protein